MKYNVLILLAILSSSCSYRCICLQKFEGKKEYLAELSEEEFFMYNFVSEVLQSPENFDNIADKHNIIIRDSSVFKIRFDDQGNIRVPFEVLINTHFCKKDPVIVYNKSEFFDRNTGKLTSSGYSIGIVNTGRFKPKNELLFSIGKTPADTDWKIELISPRWPYYTGWEKIDKRVQKHLEYDYDYFKIDEKR